MDSEAFDRLAMELRGHITKLAAVAGPLGSLALSVVRPHAPTLGLRALRWQRDLVQLGINMPLFVVHDLGLLLATENRDVCGCDSGDTAQQNASSHLRSLEILCTLLNAHPPGDFAHRCQQRQPAVLVAKRFIGEACCARAHHCLRQRATGGKVKVGEDKLVGPDQCKLF